MRAAWATTLIIATACGGSARTDGGVLDARHLVLDRMIEAGADADACAFWAP